MTFTLSLADGTVVHNTPETPLTETLADIRSLLKTAGVAVQPQSTAKLDHGRTPAQMTALTELERDWLGVYVKTTDGRRGQVWALHPMRGYLWVVIEGQAYAVHKDSCWGVRGAEQPTAWLGEDA
jgi:hypothetical protein